MSVRVLSKVWEYFPRGGSELLSMLALADWSDDEGLSFPSIASIAKKTRLSKSQARRIVHCLIDFGFVQVVGNKNGGAKGSSRRYKINLSLLTTGVDTTPIVDARGSMDVRYGSHECAYTTSGDASLTINEPPSTIKEFQLPDWVPIAEWEAFEQHRKNLKKSLTSYARKLALKQLKNIVDEGYEPKEVINESILRGWLSFYSPKKKVFNLDNVMEGVL